MEQTREQLLDSVSNRIYDIMINNRESEAKNLIYTDDMIASQSNANFNLNELKSVLQKKVGHLSQQSIKSYIKNYLLQDNNYKHVDFQDKKIFNKNSQDFFDTSNQYDYQRQMNSPNYTSNPYQNQSQNEYNNQNLSDDEIYKIFKGYDISNSGHISQSDIYFMLLEVHQTNPNMYRSPSTQETNKVVQTMYPNKNRFNIQQISNIVQKFRNF